MSVQKHRDGVSTFHKKSVERQSLTLRIVGVTGYDDFFKGQRSTRDCDVAGAATLSMGEEGITIPQNGYLYVFVSNSNTTYPVLFDNFRVSVQHSALLEETHYYPFGLAMAGISHKASGGAVNNYKFNGKEEQKDEFGIGSGLDIYDFGARQYDVQIGRWHSVDPLAETMRRWSPYCFSFNNPLRFIDPDGMSPTDPNDDRMVNYMDVKDKDGKVTRVWDYADNKDENGNEPNTPESTGLEVGDRALMQLPGEGDKTDKGKRPHQEPKRPPDEIPGFPGGRRLPHKGKARPSYDLGKTMPKRWWGEWDFKRVELEVYDKSGKHQGAFDPNTGMAREKSIDLNKTPTYNKTVALLNCTAAAVIFSINGPLTTGANFAQDAYKQVGEQTGLTGGILLLYFTVSESSRVIFPPRNIVPLP